MALLDLLVVVLLCEGGRTQRGVRVAVGTHVPREQCRELLDKLKVQLMKRYPMRSIFLELKRRIIELCGETVFVQMIPSNCHSIEYDKA